METFEYTIQDPVGLHARPAGMLVRKAQEFEAEIMLTCQGRSANLKKLLAVMGLGVRYGDTVTVSVDGDPAAAEELRRFFRDNL
ncbi:MAG: HPr family phosphocarrier protein [Ruminococcaceae bacterium]|nr:HPr family phosphocarrier protein [Oscillospiraceae bacterium]